MDNARPENAGSPDACGLTLLITQIERCAVHDGPGIRTVVFLQGCPLRCGWCCNPETQPAAPVILHDAAICVGCGACAAACINGAARLTDGVARFDREACKRCGACLRVCPVGAVRFSGRAMTLEQILAVVRRDGAFYRETGGGLTLSGGEPLLQENAVTLLKLAREEGLSTVVETTANVPAARLAAAMPYADHFFVDYKHPDAAALNGETGAWLPLIEENIRALVAAGASVTLRTPVIPGFNDGEETLARCFAFARAVGINAYVLLPYHALGRKKYDMLERGYAFDGTRVLTAGDLEPLRARGESMGLAVTIGG